MAGAGPRWYYNGIGVLGLLAASLLIATTTSLFIDGAQKRAAARGESFGAALWNILTKARTQSGGYLAHIGIGIILIGLVGSAMYVHDNNVHDPATSRARRSRSTSYTFTLHGRRTPSTLANGNQVDTLNLDVHARRPQGRHDHAGPDDVRRAPSRRALDAASSPSRCATSSSSMQQADETGITINVKINPLIWFAWGGFILLLARHRPRGVAQEGRASVRRPVPKPSRRARASGRSAS